jgi:deoxyadenosine/deoxycytidine kinase
MVTYLRKPDLIIYLETPVDKLIERILKRGRDYERTIDPEYLKKLNVAYERWIDKAEKEGFKVLRIDTASKDFEKNENDLLLIIDYIKNMENQAWLDVD